MYIEFPIEFPKYRDKEQKKKHSVRAGRSGLTRLRGREIWPAQRTGRADLIREVADLPPSGKIFPAELRPARQPHVWPSGGRSGKIWPGQVC